MGFRMNPESSIGDFVNFPILISGMGGLLIAFVAHTSAFVIGKPCLLLDHDGGPAIAIVCLFLLCDYDLHPMIING